MREPAIASIGFDKCTSCFLCADACPKKCIEIHFDDEGYYKPQVNSDCINCGVCYSLCPQINRKEYGEKFEQPEIYSGWSTNEEVRRNSSSGGIVQMLSEAFIDEGGVVCGVKFVEGVPKFDIATDKTGLTAFRGSKYLQAEASQIYNRVKKYTSDGVQVLFFGLPCQVQAMQNYVKSNLTCVDIICAGVPSKKVYDSFCKSAFGETKVDFVNFRSKKHGWRRYCVEYYSRGKLLSRKEHDHDKFFAAFNSTKIYNRACYSCDFNTIPRKGNLSLGDNWAAELSKSDDMGVSIILVNDQQGRNLFDKVLSMGVIHAESVKLEDVIGNCYRIDNSSRDMPKERETILSEIREDNFNEVYKKYFPSRPLYKKVIGKLKHIINR